MMGVSGMMPSFGDGHESGGGSGGSSEVGASGGGGVEESGGGGGNRWPRPETLALLRIRSEMDGAFRDSSLKGPLWEEVSRKLAELGFRRSAKKCKEKFENVFKYHKRTKDGRASKSDGKTYRFFDQLEALENAPPPPRPQIPSAAAMPVNSTPPMPSHNITVSSTSPNPNPNPINSSTFQISHPQPPPLTAANANANSSIPPPSNVFHQPSNPHFAAVSTSSSSTSSDEDIQRRRGKKRKWKDFFHRLMKDVIHKQEDMQKKFLEALEKRERDRLAREEAWRVQEIARMNREHEFLVQERSIAAAKDAAVITFLQKVSEQNNLQIPVISNIAVAPPPLPKNPQPPPQPTQLQLPPLPSPPLAPPKPVAVQTLATTAVAAPMKVLDSGGGGGGGDNSMAASSSRWPKAEIQALIDLRTSLDLKYQENGPKGPLWDEISAAMAKLGYNRSSKRCKEKWENINKYYKKVKEGSKKRPEDSKTCPYFHQLDAIYRERAKHDGGGGGAAAFNPENPMAPIMAMPERQWPLHDQHNPALPDQYHDNESENNDHDGGGGGGGGDGDDDEEDEEDEGGGYEIVTNKQPSSAANAAE